MNSQSTYIGNSERERTPLDGLFFLTALGVLYSIDYHTGEYPRIGLVIAMLAGGSLTGLVGISVTRSKAVYGCLGFWCRNRLFKALVVPIALSPIMYLLPIGASYVPDPFPAIYLNTYSSLAKPISHVVFFSGCWPIIFAPLLSSHRREIGLPELSYSLRSGVVLATLSYAALWGPLIPFVLYAIFRYWRECYRRSMEVTQEGSQ